MITFYNLVSHERHRKSYQKVIIQLKLSKWISEIKSYPKPLSRKNNPKLRDLFNLTLKKKNLLYFGPSIDWIRTTWWVRELIREVQFIRFIEKLVNTGMALKALPMNVRHCCQT